MSSTKRSHCPVCHNQPFSLRNGYKHLYGKITTKKYEEVVEEYVKRMRVDTVNEFYSIGLNDDGSASVNYTARCDKCHSEWKMEFDGVQPNEQRLERNKMKGIMERDCEENTEECGRNDAADSTDTKTEQVK